MPCVGDWFVGPRVARPCPPARPCFSESRVQSILMNHGRTVTASGCRSRHLSDPGLSGFAVVSPALSKQMLEGKMLTRMAHPGDFAPHRFMDPRYVSGSESRIIIRV
ncbi:hypothetical protein Bbelb_219910 [Branchiostoma belcheri]|nr:hypothetical protein Bbelb_219910 [Branchiostoma belcheri]